MKLKIKEIKKTIFGACEVTLHDDRQAVIIYPPAVGFLQKNFKEEGITVIIPNGCVKFDATLLFNGQCFTKSGWRAVAFDNALHLRPVVGTDDRGLRTGRGTFQLLYPCHNDIVLESNWGYGENSFAVPYMYVDGEKEVILPYEGESLRREIFRRYPFVEKFLTTYQRRGSSYLEIEATSSIK